jgi:hypothetical protein
MSDLVALRDRRESAIQLLSDSFAQDQLTMAEFEDRLARAHAASTVAELEPLIADLHPTKSTALSPLSIDPSLSGMKKLRSIFGNLERAGAWSVPDKMQVQAIFASAVLDFREAKFAAAVTELEIKVVCASLEIIVPPQLAVDCEASTILANLESHSGTAIADPDRPLLKIRGSIVLGNIEVHVRLPGESERDARKRRHQERTMLLQPGESTVRKT